MSNQTQDVERIKKASATYAPQNVLNCLATTIYYAGALVYADANQRAAKPAAGGAAFKVMGWLKHRVDNSTGANDARKVELETGEALFLNDGTISADDVGKVAYAADDQTASLTAANGPMMGIITEVNSNGVMVGVGPLYQTA